MSDVDGVVECLSSGGEGFEGFGFDGVDVGVVFLFGCLRDFYFFYVGDFGGGVEVLD